MFVVTMWAWPSQLQVKEDFSFGSSAFHCPCLAGCDPAISHTKLPLVASYSLAAAGAEGSQALSQPGCVLLSY